MEGGPRFLETGMTKVKEIYGKEGDLQKLIIEYMHDAPYEELRAAEE